MVVTREQVNIYRLPLRGARPMRWRSPREEFVGRTLFGRSRRFRLYDYGSGFQVYDGATGLWVPRSAIVRTLREFVDACGLLGDPLRQKEARDGLVKLGLNPEQVLVGGAASGVRPDR